MNELKTLLLMLTLLATTSLSAQEENAPEQSKDNDIEEKANAKSQADNSGEWDFTAGALNIRLEEGDNAVEYLFAKATYNVTDKFSVSGQLGHSYLAIPDESVVTLAPSIQIGGKKDKLKANFGFLPGNNEAFIKTQYTQALHDNEGFSLMPHNLLFSFHAVNTTAPLPEARFIPRLPREYKMSTLTEVSFKEPLYKDKKTQFGINAGLGLKTSPGEDPGITYRAGLSINRQFGKNKASLSFGLIPAPLVQFDQRLALGAQFSF